MDLGTTGRIARACARRPWLTIGVWAVVLGAAAYFAGSINEYVVSGSRNLIETESDIGFELDDTYRSASDGSEAYQETVVVTSESVYFSEPAFGEAIVGVEAALQSIDGVIGFSIPSLGDPFGISASGRSALIPVQTVADSDVVQEVVDAIADVHVDDVTLFVTGVTSGDLEFKDLAKEQMTRGESIGVIAAMIILVIVFGAVVAATVPLSIAFASILTAVALAATIGRVSDLSDWTLMMAAMFGLALGIDYSLMVVQRFREELSKGHDPLDAVSITGTTASRAVLLSGATVMISLGGLLLVPSSMTFGIAAGVIPVALTSVIAALTLLPAVLRLLGHRVNRGRIPTADPSKEPLGWQRIARLVVARPAVSAGIGLTILAVFIAPIASIRLADHGPESMPEDSVIHQANDIMVEEFGWGQSSTMIAIEGADEVQSQIEALAAAIEADPAYADTTVDYRGDVAFIDTHDLYDSTDQRSEDALARLRTELVPEAFGDTDAAAYVAGDQARSSDEIGLFTSRAWLVFLTVLGASFLLLLIMFRSIVVPIKAILLNLLGTAAAFGALVAAYQYGWGSALLGLPEVEAISPYMPIMIFTLLFGLSMDYHVFLLSRIRERYDAGEDSTTSIVQGLGRTGSLITGAAAIMVAVFGGFAASNLSEMSQWGFGLGFAVLLDATIIRVLLVPSFMAWLGDANWYLPQWLRWLPHIPFEAPANPASDTGKDGRQPALV